MILNLSIRLRKFSQLQSRPESISSILDVLLSPSPAHRFIIQVVCTTSLRNAQQKIELVASVFVMGQVDH